MDASSAKISKEEVIRRERKAKLICAELNNFTELKPILITVITHIKELSGCEAVGIRLHEDGDYPYYTYQVYTESQLFYQVTGKDYGAGQGVIKKINN